MSLLLPPGLCTTSALKPLLQEQNVPVAPLCPPWDIPHMLRLWLATSSINPLAPCPCKVGGRQPGMALDGCGHLWGTRAGKEAPLPTAGREMGAQSHPAHLGEVKESKQAKPALNWLAWFGSAAGETPTAGKRDCGQVTLGDKEVRRRGSSWPGCCRAPSRASWLWGRSPEVRAGGQQGAKPAQRSCSSSRVQPREGTSRPGGYCPASCSKEAAGNETVLFAPLHTRTRSPSAPGTLPQ